jgi:bifunctional polynucleotide phosphatase/kinase
MEFYKEQLSTTLIRIKFGSQPETYDSLLMFDLDNTLVTQKWEGKFPKTADDWRFRTGVVDKFNTFRGTNQKIAIITNQGGYKFGEREYLIDRIKQIIEALNIPLEVYIATSYDVWRKPNTEIFEKYLLTNLQISSDLQINPKFPVSLAQNAKPKISCMIGDAAGRDNDFADSDRKFQFNITVYLIMQRGRKFANIFTFQTPEEYFLNKPKEEYSLSGFDPLIMFHPTYEEKDTEESKKQKLNEFKKNKKENESKLLDEIKENLKPRSLWIMIGAPCSGKSTFAEKIQSLSSKVKIISQDVLGSKNLCLNHMRIALENSQIPIITNCNPTEGHRLEYIEEALYTETNLKVFYLWMSTFVYDQSRDKALYNHLNIVRERIQFDENQKTYSRIPDVAINTYWSKYEVPNEKESKYLKKIFRIEFNAQFKSKLALMRFLQRS